MTPANTKLLKEIYKLMQRNVIRQHDNGARMVGERGSLDLVIPAGCPYPRELIGYVNGGDGSILLEDFESDPVTVDGRSLVIVADSGPVCLFIDGNDAIFAGQQFVYSVPMKIPLVRERGKGNSLMLECEAARIIGLLAQLGTLQFSMSSGTIDGENLLIDIKARTDNEAFHARIEVPLVFGPWTDFAELIQTLMGGSALVAQPRIRSLKSALKKAVDAVTVPRGNRSIALAELILKDGEMKVRPLVPATNEGVAGGGPIFDDCLDPIEVKVDGMAGSNKPMFQFFSPMLMHTALEMFDGQNATISVGSQIGEPIVLWKDDVRFAIRTGKRE